MADGMDPFDRWLETDVELLSPRPGSFDAIRRRARRRKATRAAGVAAGAVVAVAALVVVPRLALPSQAGPGGPSTALGGTSVSRTAGPKTGGTGQGERGPSTSATAHSPMPGQTGPGPALVAPGARRVPAPGFRPTSVTFVGPNIGAVLGQARCAGGPCTAVAGTASYGSSWFAVGGPDAGPPGSASGASQIRFLNEHDGWAYGPGLFATHDGGATWARVSVPAAGRVIDLATVGDRAFAVLATCSGSGPAYARHCTSFALITAAAGDAANRWRLVPGAAAPGRASPGALQLATAGGYLLAGGHLFTGPVTGGAWHQVAVSPAGGPPCLGAGTAGAPAAGWHGLLAPAPGELFLYCSGGPATGAAPAGLYGSSDGGTSWTFLAPAGAAGTPTSMAVTTPGSTLVLATTAGIYYSDTAHGTLAWQPASLPGPVPPGGFSFIGMTTSTQGVAVPTAAGQHEVMITTDGGMIWQARPIG
ncbi:MAG: hypothetical protein ACYCO9_07035 [Streptosporangiaceae bacterium]